MLDPPIAFRLMTQVRTEVHSIYFFCLNSAPGVGDGPQLGRYPSKSESPPTGGKAEGHLLEPSGRPGGHLIGMWRRLQDLNTRLTPIHLVREGKDWLKRISKVFQIMNLNTGEPLRQPLPGRMATCKTKLYSQAKSARGKGEQI